MPSQRSYIVKGFMGGHGFPEGSNNTLFNSYDMSSYPIFDAVVEKEVNKVDSFKFIMGALHPAIDAVEEFRNWVLVIQYVGSIENGEWQAVDEDILFYGRVIEVDTDLYGNKEISCEGSLGFLNDLTCRIKDIAGYTYNTQALVSGILTTQNDVYPYYTYEESGGPEGDPRYKWDMIGKDFKEYYESYGPRDPRNSYSPSEMEIDSVNTISTSDSDAYTDVSITSLMDIISQYGLDYVGGAFYLRHWIVGNLASPIDSAHGDYISQVCVMMAYKRNSVTFGIGTGGGGMVSYDWGSILNPEEYPRFILGENVANISKEQALDTIYTGVLPVGKDGLLLTSVSDVHDSDYVNNYLWHTSSRRKYGSVVITLDFSNITTRSALRTVARNWIDEHASDGLINEYKYTVTGPEPVVMGYGDYFIKPLFGVMYSSDTSTLPADSKVYPCLSMKIDLFNAQNNEYTFGPFVSDNYSDTNISTKMSQVKTTKKAKKK